MPLFRTSLSNGKPVTVNVRPESTLVMEGNETTYTFDSEGRLLGAYIDGRNYRRSLSNRVLEKANGAAPGLFSRVRRFLTPQEVQLLEILAYDFARRLLSQWGSQALGSNGGSDVGIPIEAREALERVARYDYVALEQEREVYEKTYQPVTILPPDQYLALYLQATEGCAFNACAFCGFYRDRQFRAKSLGEFQRHILDVRQFFGGGLRLRRSIFLGDANALMIKQSLLVPMLDAINEQFAIMPRGLKLGAQREWQAAHPNHFGGIYSFIDAFSTRPKTREEFQELSERNLRRVYLGLESGDAAVLKFLGKPHLVEDVEQLVAHVKRAGVAIGLVILAGAGGSRFHDAHIEGTTNLVNALDLGSGDLIYFSEMIDYPGSTYSVRVQSAGIVPLTLGEIEEQIAEMRGGFVFRDAGGAPKISLYDIREFVY